MAINSTVDAIRSAVGQAAAGQKPTSDSVDPNSSSSGQHGTTNPESYENSETVVRAEESTIDRAFASPTDDTSGENNPTDSSETSGSEASPSEAKPGSNSKTPGNKEVLTVTDDKGRRRVEVDFNNREQLKKYVQMAYGARKWQAERDQAIQSGKKTSEELQKSKDNWSTLDSVYKRQGIAGLVDLLEGRPGAHQAYERKLVEKHEWLKKASPEEVEALKFRDEADRIRKENAEIREQNEKFKSEVQQERETAELRSMESRVNPIFDKYRFADKLGDEHDEHLFDEMLWNSALKRLEPYEDRGLDITPELIDREFKAVAGSIRRRIGAQAGRQTAKAIEQKKKEATENVQAKVMSGYRSGGAAEEARALLNSGNTLGLLKGFGKYKDFFKK